MHKKFIKIAFVVAVVIVSGINVFNVQKSESLSDAVLANVEALAELENVNKGKYCTLHIRCYDSNGSATGEYRASSYQGEACSHETSHEHGCSSCKSR